MTSKHVGNGAVKFPADKLQAVLANARALHDIEENRIGRLRKALGAAEVREILGGGMYAKDGRR